MTEGRISVEGLAFESVLRALYNNAVPVSIGILEALSAPYPLPLASARALVGEGFVDDDEPLRVDFVFGRRIKLVVKPDFTFDPEQYDTPENGGPGAAQRVIDRLRADGRLVPEDAIEYFLRTLRAVRDSIETKQITEDHIRVMFGQSLGLEGSRNILAIALLAVQSERAV